MGWRYRAVPLALALGATCLSSGCAIQFGGGDTLTVWGVAWVEESREIEKESNQAARTVRVVVPGINFSLTPARTGIILGLSSDALADIYLYEDDEAVEQEISAWFEEVKLQEEGLADRREKCFAILPKRFKAPPGASLGSKPRRVTILGIGINLLEQGFHLGVPYSATNWTLGYAEDPPVAYRISDDLRDVALIDFTAP